MPKASEALKFWRGFDSNNRQTAVAALVHAQAWLDAGAKREGTQALSAAEASVKASGGPNEHAWLGKLKHKAASGGGRLRVREG